MASPKQPRTARGVNSIEVAAYSKNAGRPSSKRRYRVATCWQVRWYNERAPWNGAAQEGRHAAAETPTFRIGPARWSARRSGQAGSRVGVRGPRGGRSDRGGGRRAGERQ